MKKGTKIIFSTIMIVMMVILTVAPVFAATTGAVDPKTLTGSSNANTTTMQNIGNQIITVVSVAGSIVSVVVLIVLGIKYMMGSAEEKSRVQKDFNALYYRCSTCICGFSYSRNCFQFCR